MPKLLLQRSPRPPSWIKGAYFYGEGMGEKGRGKLRLHFSNSWIRPCSEPGSARYSSAPSLTTVWSNCQTKRLLWSLYHKNGDFITCSNGPLTSLILWMSFVLIGQSPTADAYRYSDHKYVNIHSHQLFIFSEINMDNRWQWLSFNAKL